MAAYQKLKWRRTLNEYKFATEERKIVDSINREAAPLFQEHYEIVLAEHGLDLGALNRQHAQQIKSAYNLGDADPIGGGVPHTSSCESLVRADPMVEKTEEAQLTEDEIILHQMFSKLFKNIALKIHPDKIDPHVHSFEERRKINDSFKIANTALKERNYFILIELAEEWKIPLPKNYDQQTRWMKKQINEVMNEINAQKNTYNYLFAEKETKEEKDVLIRQFIKQLFNIDLG
tara:strand:- start:215 stop:913 length:699 start_codon:yes stop_codon:yes gene_type:complete